MTNYSYSQMFHSVMVDLTPRLICMYLWYHFIFTEIMNLNLNEHWRKNSSNYLLFTVGTAQNETNRAFISSNPDLYNAASRPSRHYPHVKHRRRDFSPRGSWLPLIIAARVLGNTMSAKKGEVGLQIQARNNQPSPQFPEPRRKPGIRKIRISKRNNKQRSGVK